MTDMINQFAAFYQQPANCAAWQIEYQSLTWLAISPIRPGWSGFVDYHLFDSGLMVSRGVVNHQGVASEPPMPFCCYLGVHIVLQADYCIECSQLKQRFDISERQLWRRQGDMGEVACNWGAGGGACRVVTLDFTPELLARWREDFALPGWLDPDYRGAGTRIEVHPVSQALVARTAQLLQQPVQTLADRLALEAVVLSLCTELFALLDEPARPHTRIDDAIDIIRSEFNQNLTIHQLARRVGMNECYLKHQFKQHTGTTIAAYIRDIRMQSALQRLQEDRLSLQELAYHVGYRNPGHFSKVFKQTFGYSPAAMLTNHENSR